MKIVAAVTSSILLATAIRAHVFSATTERCEQLASLAQPDTTITAALSVPAGRVHASRSGSGHGLADAARVLSRRGDLDAHR